MTEELFAEILAAYEKDGYSEELVRRFRGQPCPGPCEGCPLDKQVGRYVVCDHLLHGDRATDWEEIEGGKEYGKLDGEGDT